MAETAAVDPSKDAEAAHLYLTAVPTRGLPEMLLDITKDKTAQLNFATRIVTTLGNEILRADGPDRSEIPLAFNYLGYNRRSPRQHGAVFTNFDLENPNGPNTPDTYLALGDSGTVRYIDLSAGSLRDGAHPSMASLPVDRRISPFGTSAIVYSGRIFYHTLDVIRLIARLSTEHNYTGAWMLGLSLVNMHGRYSDLNPSTPVDIDELTATHRVTTAQLVDRHDEVAAALLRPIFRDLGAEKALDGTLEKRNADPS